MLCFVLYYKNKNITVKVCFSNFMTKKLVYVDLELQVTFQLLKLNPKQEDSPDSVTTCFFSISFRYIKSNLSIFLQFVLNFYDWEIRPSSIYAHTQNILTYFYEWAEVLNVKNIQIVHVFQELDFDFLLM